MENIETIDWALKESGKAAKVGDFLKAEKYQNIVDDSLAEKTYTEIPSGGIGFFITAEKKKKEIIT